MRNKKQSTVSVLFTILTAVLFNGCVGALGAVVIGVPPIVGAVTWNAVGLIAPAVNVYHYIVNGVEFTRVSGLALEGLNKELWIDRLLLDLFPKNDYMDDLEDLTHFVDNDKINLASIGSAPNVEEDRTVYPIPLAPREDMPHELELKEYSTDSTLVQDAETVELAYNKLDSVLKQHKEQILLRLGNGGVFNIAPEADSNYTPIIETSGGTNGTDKKLVKADIAKLSLAWDNLNYPKEGRVLLMSPALFWEFIGSDETLNRQYEMSATQGVVTGVLLNYYGFQIRTRTGMPHYEKIGSVWTRKAFGSEVAGGDKYAAIAYIKGQSGMKAVGDTKMYGGDREDEGYQGYIINFRMRGLVAPFRQRLLGAIVQVAA